MRIAVCLAVAMAVALAAGAAQAVTITFDDLAAGTVLTNQYAGVTFSNPLAGGLFANTATPGPPFSAPMAIQPVNYRASGNYNLAVFDLSATSVSVVMGDFDGDEDVLHLEAYDAGNNLLASDVQVLPAPVNGGLVLSVSASNIAYVQFYGRGGGVNSVYFDNFTFDAGVVPEPLTALGLVAGAGALAGYLRRRKA